MRKLLLHRAEIDKLYGETQIGGRALVLLNLHWKNGKLKAEVAVAQEKVARDKRADLKKASDRSRNCARSRALQSQTWMIEPPRTGLKGSLKLRSEISRGHPDSRRRGGTSHVCRDGLRRNSLCDHSVGRGPSLVLGMTEGLASERTKCGSSAVPARP